MKEIEEYLKNLTGYEIEVRLSGFITGNLKIEKSKYCIEYDILSITDEQSSNNICINLNQVIRTKIDNERHQMVLYLDNDLNISIHRRVKESI